MVLLMPLIIAGGIFTEDIELNLQMTGKCNLKYKNRNTYRLDYLVHKLQFEIYNIWNRVLLEKINPQNVYGLSTCS